MTQSKRSFLYRYTTIAPLIYMLENKSITLLNPQTWDDRSDSKYLEKYKEKKGYKSLLALCFSRKRETYHHWHVFAQGLSGARIDFRRNRLLSCVDLIDGVRHGDVEYLTMSQNRHGATTANLLGDNYDEKWPFLKRYAFKDEDEYRIIYGTKEELIDRIDVPFDISCIKRITLGARLDSSLFDCMRSTLRKIDGCQKIEIYPSKLLDNDQWNGVLDKG